LQHTRTCCRIACADDMRERRHTFRVLTRDLLSRPPNIETVDVILHQNIKLPQMLCRGSANMESNKTHCGKKPITWQDITYNIFTQFL
jgi:hypothetical protein